VTRAAKTLARMRRIESLKSIADAVGLTHRQPGGSHVIFRHPNGAMLSVPARRPIKPLYVKKFVRLVEEGNPE
jgi:predicted RNA binding protein YcfA (HicA-like mRNA interferase family)